MGLVLECGSDPSGLVGRSGDHRGQLTPHFSILSSDVVRPAFQYFINTSVDRECRGAGWG